MTAMLAVLLVLQGQASPPEPGSAAPVTTASAARAAVAPVLDGRDDDPVWRAATLIDGFLMARPREGGDPRFRTTARLAYDEHNLYAFIRAYDPHPDSIVSLLSRRDDQTASDQLILMLDSYHDQRTGFEFVVNPAGVKADYAIYNDGDEDGAWNAVWDAATRIDSLGWTAEYRIPLSQLSYKAPGSGAFGLLIWRNIQRHTEIVTWPLYRDSQSGFVSQFGTLSGLDSLASPGKAEFTPYIVATNLQGPASAGFAREQDVTVGGDLKYRLASNLHLNATVNPDFGQVEADPSDLNLSAFETFFEERRPFFVEGRGQYSFPLNCVVVLDCSTGEGLFYSRRIGRSPQLAGIHGDDSSPTATRILGAAKLNGRFPGGLSMGALDAVTGHVSGPGTSTLEPTTNYGVVRVNQDLDGGDASLGLILTSVNRALDESSESYLHRSAYAVGVDARRRFAGNFEASGSLAFTRVAGTPDAIALTQQSPVHLYQRPDGPLTFDPSRTSLGGSSAELRFAKVGGGKLRFETAYQRRSPGFESNDVGFLLQADQQEWTTWAALAFRTPNKVFRSLRWNFNNWEYWTFDGLPTERAFNTNVHTQFNNRWWLHMGGTLGQLGTTWCDRCARGGPAIRQDTRLAPWMGIEGDNRYAVVPYLWVNYSRGDGGRSESISLSPEVVVKVSSRFRSSLSANYRHNRDDNQYFGTFTGPTDDRHFTFAHLDQETLSFTWRLDYTFTPEATLQLYASPFVSRGTYSNVRELADPGADAYDARYQPYTDPAVSDDPGGFNFKQFRSNVVFRWEYRPGSTLFLVWSQGRQHETALEGDQSFGGDLRELFRQRANNTFLVKVSYWFAG
jgi:hypothetical protein